MAIPLKGWQGVISFEGPERGSVGVSMPAELAVILAGTMAGTDIGTSPGIQADAVGETANILSSSVLALLYGTRNHVQISSPVVSGDPADLASSTSSEVVSLGILVDEEFFVQVWLRVATPPGL
ncbi:MAG: chemotaxis protein CheX [Myxococcales bacterium]|nr:chemotaxis protein CheX [Myxococcales bacterium]